MTKIEGLIKEHIAAVDALNAIYKVREGAVKRCKGAEKALRSALDDAKAYRETPMIVSVEGSTYVAYFGNGDANVHKAQTEDKS